MATRRLFDGAAIELKQVPIVAAAVSATISWLNVSGVWKQVTVWLNVGGTWKTTTQYINVSGNWK